MTLANYKIAGAAFIVAMNTAGFTQTADTGQVNYSTVAAVPASAGTDYMIFQFTDAFQATAPFYIKVFSYSTQSASVDKGFMVDFIVCTRTDGAGAPRGNASGQFSVIQTANVTSANTNRTAYICGDGSYWSVIWDPTSADSTAAFRGGWCIERLKDATGAIQNIGVAITMDGRTNGKQAQVVFSEYYGGVYPSSISSWTAAVPNSGTASFGGNIGLFPVFPNLGYPYNPNVSVLACFCNDIPTPGSTFSATLYGVARTYMVTSQYGLVPSGLNGNGNIVMGGWLYQ